MLRFRVGIRLRFRLSVLSSIPTFWVLRAMFFVFECLVFHTSIPLYMFTGSKAHIISKLSGILKAGDFFSFIFTGRNFIFRLFLIMQESKQRDITELIIERFPLYIENCN